ncbi:MAG: hypothetical protein GY861_17485 [bacterium]|nr:hypothetical protein [bacterium]
MKARIVGNRVISEIIEEESKVSNKSHSKVLDKPNIDKELVVESLRVNIDEVRKKRLHYEEKERKLQSQIDKLLQDE